MKSTEPLSIIIDADVLLFQASSAVETPIDWGSDLWTLHSDIGEAKEILVSRVKAIVKRIVSKMKPKSYNVIMCVSAPVNFRKLIYPDYKANRKETRKPCCYYGLKEWLRETYDCREFPLCEGDDTCSILATSLPNSITVSIDKDFMTIPRPLYNPLRDEFSNPTKTSAIRWWFTQTLTGDVCDHYPGAKGIGAKTAEKILSNDCSWEAVVKAYESKGLTEADALIQARVARILHTEDYNMETGEIYLWSPEGQPRETIRTKEE